MQSPVLQRVKQLFSRQHRDAQLQASLERLRQRTPVPVFWLFGKTQSGKTSVVRFLTGADDAEIGQGFKPCTRFSRQYQFPTADAPLLTFLDTRGLDEPGYDPHEDLAQFGNAAHAVIVTAKAMDHAQENVVRHLGVLRAAQPHRPVVLVLTCLHDAYPQQQHPEPYPFTGRRLGKGVAVDSTLGPLCTPHSLLGNDLIRSLEEHGRRFQGLADWYVPVDLTRPEDGFDNPHYGGEELRKLLIDVLPEAYRQTLLTLNEATSELKDLYARHSLPHILGYSTLAATAGAVPIPWLDLLILPGIQTRMIYHLARLYGQPLTGTRFLELASTLGIGMLARQAAREVMKFIPYVGSVAGAVLAGASTFALGKAFCYYYSAVHQGHVPQADDLRRYYEEQLALAKQHWTISRNS